jgi:hypothetical protein
MWLTLDFNQLSGRSDLGTGFACGTRKLSLPHAVTWDSGDRFWGAMRFGRHELNRTAWPGTTGRTTARRRRPGIAAECRGARLGGVPAPHPRQEQVAELGLPGSSRRTGPRCPAEKDLADHRSIEIDHEKARAPARQSGTSRSSASRG